MSAAVVDSVVARCLMEPGYLDRLRTDPDAELDRLPVGDAVRAELATLDVEQLRRFGGLISKVQHNDTWDQFPLTRALLKFYGQELAVFSDYRDRHLTLLRSGRPTADARTSSFLSFLGEHLATIDPDTCPGLVDVLVHERLSWEVARELADPEPEREAGPGERVVPRDILRVGALQYHPYDVAAWLRDDRATVVESRPVYLAYRGRRRAADVTVLEVDAITASILACVNGHRPAADVVAAAHTVLPEVGRADLEAALEEAVARDVVAVVRPARSE